MADQGILLVLAQCGPWKNSLEMAERDGYEARNVDNYAGHFTFGQGEEELGIFAHLDVVPAGSGWKTDPYEAQIIDGKLYARGASDDKGLTMACYYGLKIIKDLGLPVSKRVRFVVGTDEELQAGRIWIIILPMSVCQT